MSPTVGGFGSNLILVTIILTDITESMIAVAVVVIVVMSEYTFAGRPSEGMTRLCTHLALFRTISNGNRLPYTKHWFMCLCYRARAVYKS